MFDELLRLLISLDKILFSKINQDWVNPLYDKIMPFITDFHNTKIYLIVFVVLYLFGERLRAAKIIFGCILAVGLSDILAAQVVKPLVHRERPDIAESNVRLLVDKATSYGFPSNHAANCFSAATYLGAVVPSFRIFVWVIALAVSYSRIYVGVHYPGDVAGGALLGILCALFVLSLWGDQIRRKPSSSTRYLTNRYKSRYR